MLALGVIRNEKFYGFVVDTLRFGEREFLVECKICADNANDLPVCNNGFAFSCWSDGVLCFNVFWRGKLRFHRVLQWRKPYGV